MRKSIYFELFIMLLIAISGFTVAVEGRPGSLDRETAAALHTVDLVILGMFWLEVVLRSISRGFIFTQDAYITDGWNKIVRSALYNWPAKIEHWPTDFKG